MMFLQILFLSTFLISAYSYTFITTKNLYNGTTGFNGLFVACQKENKNSKPCTLVELLQGFWRSTNQQNLWVLDMYMNCLGYSTNSSSVGGTCLMPSTSQLTMCTCEMLLPICCYF